MLELLDTLKGILANPIVQSSALPLLAGLVCAALLYPLRLEGLAALAGFLAAVFAIGNFGLEPLTATRKIVLLGGAAAVLGVLVDLAGKPTRYTGMAFGALFGAAALWVFAAVLRQKIPLDVAVTGAGAVALTAWLVAATVSLQYDSARAGAAGRILGFHVCDWRVPTRDLVFDRAMMGDGAIAIRKIRRMVEDAGYTGYIEAEIFSKDDWWRRDPDEVLRVIAERYRTVV